MSLHILVTGGAGFIGSHLTDALLAAGHHVRVIDNLVNGKRENIAHHASNPRFQFIEGDITDQAAIAAATAGVDAVYHLACLGVRHSLHSPYPNHWANAEGTICTLEAAKAAGVRKYFYISSSEVFGKSPAFPLTEDSLPRPTTVYGASKLVGEHYALAYHEMGWLDATVLRIFNNYGPRAHHEGDAGEVIPRTIVSALANRAPVVYGDGSVTRDFFYVKDTASVLLSLMAHTGLGGQTLNIGTGEEITILNLLQLLLEEMGRTDLAIQYLPDRPADVPRLWVNADRFKRLTGFRPSVTFREGLRETIAYYTNLVTAGKDLASDVKATNWN